MRSELRRGSGILAGMMIGAALMYVLDPARGRRRRAMMRDQVVHAGHELADLGDAARARAHDLGNRARGMAAETRSRWRREPVDDVVLEERVRSELGHVMTNPGSLTVAAEHGCVTLSGPVLADEMDRVVATVEGIAGVRDVVNRLHAHQDPAHIPGLQGQPDPGAVH